jgi:tetratricopeptide (TPR) repeat protein
MPAEAMKARLHRWYLNQAAAWCVLFRRRDVALDFYRRMLELDPEDALALASLGFQHAQLGQKRDALAMFERLAALKPDDAEAHFDRGFLLQELGDHEAAMAAFRRALAANPDHDRAHYGLALSLIATGRHAEAVAPLKRNTRLQPMSPYGWYQLARVEHDLGHVKEAQKILDPLATFEPRIARQLARETGLTTEILA